MLCILASEAPEFIHEFESNLKNKHLARLFTDDFASLRPAHKKCSLNNEIGPVQANRPLIFQSGF